MSAEAKQQSLLRSLSILPDPQERLCALVSRVASRPKLSPSEKAAAHRVAGCVSQVWVVSSLADGCCHFLCEADSPVVAGLVGLLCEIYDGASPDEILAVEPSILHDLGIFRNLSPTRQNGLAAVREFIRGFARACGAS